jgi:hypothetical protein
MLLKTRHNTETHGGPAWQLHNLHTETHCPTQPHNPRLNSTPRCSSTAQLQHTPTAVHSSCILHVIVMS